MLQVVNHILPWSCDSINGIASDALTIAAENGDNIFAHEEPEDAPWSRREVDPASLFQFSCNRRGCVEEYSETTADAGNQHVEHQCPDGLNLCLLHANFTEIGFRSNQQSDKYRKSGEKKPPADAAKCERAFPFIEEDCSKLVHSSPRWIFIRELNRDCSESSAVFIS